MTTASPLNTPRASDLLAAADACDRAAAARDPEEQARAVMAVWAHKETIQLALIARQMQRVAATPRGRERLPLRAEGDDYGRVEARIPKRLFFHLQQQRNFGWDGFCDHGGMKDFLKAYPQCKVETVSGRVVSGPGSKPAPRSRARPRVHFGPNTLNLAT